MISALTTHTIARREGQGRTAAILDPGHQGDAHEAANRLQEPGQRAPPKTRPCGDS